ncbi:sugar phosphate isomerase/epimerase [Myxococcota bacterium]|nr:sugar phosphate isomerase/epimerase [Myxococcota bacterium]
MLGPNDLVFCSGTLLAGSFNEMVEAAVAGGYRAITLWPQDVQRARAEGHTPEDLRKLLSDNGLVVADLDPLLNWSDQILPGPGQAAIELSDEREFYEIAEMLGARSLNLAQGFGDTLNFDAAAEDLAGVCNRAREHGLIVTVEFLPWSGIPNASAAYDLVQRTGCENATIMLDTWHWFRSGADLEPLRTIPGDRIGSTQLNDAPVEAWEDLPRESMEARLTPGEGVIPIADVVRVLDEIGSTAPMGVEVFNKTHDDMPPAEVGRKTAEATRRVLQQARS